MEPPRVQVPTLPLRDRWILLLALTALAVLSWAYLKWSPMPMPATSGGLQTRHYYVLTFLMWFVMMVGMMTPSVAPTVLLFDRVARRGDPQAALTRTLPFVAGYLGVWLLFSVAATRLQVALMEAGWVDAMAVAVRPGLSAALLAAVGAYQWLPAKRACLDHCRSPAQFLALAYRPGSSGALRMGAHHGLFCLGCCWALMLLLFVGGVMNLLWVAALTGVVFVEKLLPGGEWLRRGIGLACLGAAALVLVRALT